MKIKVTDDNGSEKTYDADKYGFDQENNLCLRKDEKPVAVYRDRCWESLEFIPEEEKVDRKFSANAIQLSQAYYRAYREAANSFGWKSDEWENIDPESQRCHAYAASEVLGLIKTLTEENK